MRSTPSSTCSSASLACRILYRRARPPAVRTSSSAFVGVAGGREVFPLTTSINLYSIVASASVAGLVVMRLRSPERLPRAVAWLGIVVCLYELLAGDSRATLAVTVAVIALFLLRRRFAGASGVAAVIPFFPLIIIGALDLLANTGIADVLGRGGDFGSVASGTGRVYIWKGTWEVLRHFELQHLIGWGAAGQIPSGASIHYAFVFAGQPLAYTVFTHDVVLQTILDEGYIGLAILVAVIWRTFLLLGRHVRREPASPAAALIAMLLVIVLSGATEVSPSYYSEEVLLMTFLISGAAAALAVVGAGRADACIRATDVMPSSASRRILDRFLPYSHVHNPWRRAHPSQPRALRALLLPVIRLGLLCGFRNIDYALVNGPRSRLEIGPGCSTVNTVFNVASGRVTVGADTVFSNDCQVLTGIHRFHAGRRAEPARSAPV